jgi:hypothetical protein
LGAGGLKISRAVHPRAGELMEQGAPAFEAAVPILSQLLKAETAEREVRSVAYQIKAARFPAYKDLSGFDFASSEINEALVYAVAGTRSKQFAEFMAKTRWPFIVSTVSLLIRQPSRNADVEGVVRILVRPCLNPLCARLQPENLRSDITILRSIIE